MSAGGRFQSGGGGGVPRDGSGIGIEGSGGASAGTVGRHRPGNRVVMAGHGGGERGPSRDEIDFARDQSKIEILGLPKWANPSASASSNSGARNRKSIERTHFSGDRSGDTASAKKGALTDVSHRGNGGALAGGSRSRRRTSRRDSSNADNIVMSGHLYKQSQRGKWSTSPRYCELVDLRGSQLDAARGVPACISVTSRRNKEKPFDITENTWVDARPRRVDAPQNYVFEVVTPSRHYRFCAETSSKRDEWLNKLRMFIRVENDHKEPRRDRKWHGGVGANVGAGAIGGGDTNVSRHGESPSDVGSGSGEYRSDDSFQTRKLRRRFFNEVSSGGEHSADSEDDERGSHHSRGDEIRTERSSILSDSDMDHEVSSPDLRPERYRNSASDNKLRSVDSTLRDLQGMLDDDDTWN